MISHLTSAVVNGARRIWTDEETGRVLLAAGLFWLIGRGQGRVTWFRSLGEATGIPADRLREAQVPEFSELRNALLDLVRSAESDALTGLPGRVAVDRALDSALATVACRPVSVAVIDIDHFKGVNDRYGHLVGDEALRDVARTLLGAANGILLSRWGGEEFVALMPRTSSQQAYEHAQTLRAAVAADLIWLGSGHGATAMTVSVGVATTRTDTDVDVLARADAALLQAKREGRDCVVGVT